MSQIDLYFKQLPAEDQMEIAQSIWLKLFTGLLSACQHRIKAYVESDSMSGGVTKLITDMDLCAAFLEKSRAELIKFHKMDGYPPGPKADDILSGNE